MVKKVCVIGAGIVGLSTAVCIQERIPGAEVTVMAAEFSPNLTSDVAAGLIEPFLCPDDDPKVINKWCKETMVHIRKYMKEMPDGGGQEMSGYFFQRNVYEAPFWAEIMPNFRRLTPKELEEKHSLPQKSGFFYTTLYLEPTKHLSWLMEKFHKNRGKVVKRELKKLSDVGEHWDVIVNCTGLGARQLADDQKVVPVRGQIIRVRAPQVKHFFIDDDFYTLLNDDCLILGGTKDVNEWDLTVNQTTAWRILEGNCRNVPALKNAEIISHHVGLRPSRPRVRIESGEISTNSKKTPVVHNYGHGGSGITLFWGTALKAARLVQQHLGAAKL